MSLVLSHLISSHISTPHTTSRRSLTGELSVVADNDPAVLEELRGKVKQVVDAANRWTNNIVS